MARWAGWVWGCQTLTFHGIGNATVCATAWPWRPLLPCRCVQAAIAVFAVCWVPVHLPTFQSLGSLGLWTSKGNGHKVHYQAMGMDSQSFFLSPSGWGPLFLACIQSTAIGVVGGGVTG